MKAVSSFHGMGYSKPNVKRNITRDSATMNKNAIDAARSDNGKIFVGIVVLLRTVEAHVFEGVES